MHPGSACVGFISTCSASISSPVLPSLAKNSATQTTCVEFLFGILASLFYRFEGVIEIESLLGRLVSVDDLPRVSAQGQQLARSLLVLGKRDAESLEEQSDRSRAGIGRPARLFAQK